MSEILSLDIDQIRESTINPRKDFGDLTELAESIKEHGVLSPVLVRPQNGAYELVFGHRRLRAARQAGVATVPAMAREMTDVGVLEAQVIENCQRKDIHPLEEADGYRTLHEKYGYSVDEIAAKVGKSWSAVYGRMKLCDLAAPARKLFLEGRLSASVALLIARIPVPELQKEAASEVTGDRWDGPMSHRAALDYIQRQYMLQLSNAGFKTSDAELIPEAGPCTTCPKRTGNQKELFADVKSADVCTDPICFKAKQDAEWKRRTAAAKRNGQKVLPEKEAKNLFHYGGGLSFSSNYVDLKGRCEDDPKSRTYRKLLGKESPPPILARDANGAVHELLTKTAAAKALKDKGYDFAKKPSPQKEQQAQWKERDRCEKERSAARKATASLAIAEIVTRAEKRKLDAEFLRLVLHVLFADINHNLKTLLKRRQIPQRSLETRLTKMLAGEMQGLLLEACLSESPYWAFYSNYPKTLTTAAEALGVDLKALANHVRAERKAKASKKKAKKKVASKKSRKKATRRSKKVA